MLLVLDVGIEERVTERFTSRRGARGLTVADRSVDYLLVGGGLAAASCARWLREEGADGSILLVGREFDPPYNRPPLSKGYLRGKESREDDAALPPRRVVGRARRRAAHAHERDEARHRGARGRRSPPRTRSRFDKALVATGANVRRLRAEGAELDGIHYLRAFGNSDAIRADAAEAERVVLIGGSYIGCEVAASLTAAHGVKCSIVMQEEVALERHFGREAGGFFHGVLAEHGIELHGGDELARFEGADGRVTKVVTAAGLELECDCVVIGAGVTPDVMLARAAGLELGESGGVRCSRRPRELGARHLRRGRQLRVRERHPRAAAPARALGRGRQPRPARPRSTCSGAAWTTTWSPTSSPTSPTGCRSSTWARAPASRCYAARSTTASSPLFWVDGGRVTAALAVGRSEDLEHARRFIVDGATPGPAALADLGTDLAGL